MKKLNRYAPILLALFAICGIIVGVNAGSLGPPSYPSSGSGITSLTGDVTAAGPGAAAATVAKINGQTVTPSGTTGTNTTNLVFSTSPTLVTPALGTVASGVISACTSSGMVLTAPAIGTPVSGILDNCTFHLTINTQANDYTAVLTDDTIKEVQMTKGTATTFSIPTNGSVNFPVGTQINVVQYGAGAVTITASNAGTTTIHSAGATAGSPVISAQYQMAVCIQQATDVWLVAGSVK